MWKSLWCSFCGLFKISEKERVMALPRKGLVFDAESIIRILVITDRNGKWILAVAVTTSGVEHEICLAELRSLIESSGIPRIAESVDNIFEAFDKLRKIAEITNVPTSTLKNDFK